MMAATKTLTKSLHDRVAELMRQLTADGARSFTFAELHDLLYSMSADDLRRALVLAPVASLAPETANYLAAMVETACVRADVDLPAWTRSITPLTTPLFGSRLKSLRLHLLSSSPPAFRRRNIFIDTTLGGRI